MTPCSQALKLNEVAQQLGVALRTVQVWVDLGDLQVVNVSRDLKSRRPRLRVLQRDLDAFVALRRSAPPAPTARRTRRQPVEIPQHV